MLLLSDDDEQHSGVAQAVEHLRVIRQVMDRSTKHSTLSGFSGIVVAFCAWLGVVATYYVERSDHVHGSPIVLRQLGLIWSAALFAAIATDFSITKRRAARVGKTLFSRIGAHIVAAASPGFAAGFVLTLYLVLHGRVHEVYGFWMLAYGIATCAVGQLSAPPVRVLGWSFVAAGALTLFLPHSLGLTMMAISFGGFHLIYGLYTGINRGDW